MRRRLIVLEDGTPEVPREVLDGWEADLDELDGGFAELLESQRQHEEDCQSLARRKDEVMATVAHELRNPLSTIGTGLEVLRHQPHSGPVLSGDRTFRIVREQVAHMVRLLDDMLETRREAATELALSLGPEAIGRLVEQAVLAVEERVRGRSQRLTIDVPPHEIRVRADAGRFVQVLVNLLDNASKYTDDGGRLGVRVEADEHACMVRVWDEGLGIVGDEVQRLQASFTQGQALPGRVQSGMGIGLGLAGRIVELHGGSLQILSRDQGRPRGTEVVVRLDREQGPGIPRPPSRPYLMATTVLKIVVVDGHAQHAMVVSQLLEARGHVVRVAGRRLQALELVASLQPDLVVLDIDMRSLGGHGLALRIRQLAPHAELVGMSGQPLDPEQTAAFDACVLKPVGAAQLAAVLDGREHDHDP